MISLFFAQKYDRKYIEALPVGVYIFMLLSYLLAVTGHVSHITGLLMIYELAGLALVICMTRLKKAALLKPLADPGNLIFVLLLIILRLLSLHMRVTNFDDFHSWAITPKDMFFVNGMPTGNMASTFYRDYFPLVYIMDFLFFKLSGGFSESGMFFVLWALMSVSMSGFFHHREDDDNIRYICRVSAGIMLPFLVSFQFLHCLGLDILATLIFGSVLVYIMEEVEGTKPGDGQTGFVYLRIILATSVLAMMKTTSIVLAAVCIGVYFVRRIEPGKLLSWGYCILYPVITGGFWMSWKVFCRIKGNTTYLSENLDRNLTSGHMGFPSYTGSTVKEFCIKLFTYGLNDGAAGLTSVIILLIFVFSYIIYKRRKGPDIRSTLSFVTVIAGMAGYLLVMIYIYLFVFEEWEALTLSSYDRYIATYFGAMLFVALYFLLVEEIRPVWAMPALVLMLAVTLNYPFIMKTLSPAGFDREFGETVREIDSISDEFFKAAGEQPAYGEKIVIVDPSQDQLRAKVLPYAAVPGVTRLIRPDADGNVPAESEIEETAEEYGARVIDLRR